MSDAEKLIDSKIAASDARTDAKFARLDGKMDLLISKVEAVDGHYRSIRSNIWGVALALGALILGMMALIYSSRQDTLAANSNAWSAIQAILAVRSLSDAPKAPPAPPAAQPAPAPKKSP